LIPIPYFNKKKKKKKKKRVKKITISSVSKDNPVKTKVLFQARIELLDLNSLLYCNTDCNYFHRLKNNCNFKVIFVIFFLFFPSTWVLFTLYLLIIYCFINVCIVSIICPYICLLTPSRSLLPCHHVYYVKMLICHYHHMYIISFHILHDIYSLLHQSMITTIILLS